MFKSLSLIIWTNIQQMCNNEQFLIKLQVQWITGISHFFQTISHHWAVYNHSKIAVFNRPIALRQAGKVPTIERQPSLRKVTSKLGHGMERSGPGQPSGAVTWYPTSVPLWRFWSGRISGDDSSDVLPRGLGSCAVRPSVVCYPYQPFGSSLRSTMYTRVSFT